MDPLELSPELAKIAYEEFGETSELRKQAIIELRQKIECLSNPNDRLIDTSDRNLIRFIRSRKYNIDEALQSTIKMQHFITKFYSDFYYDKKDSKFIDYISNSRDFLQVIRENGTTGRVITIMKPAKGIKVFTPELKKNVSNAMLKFNIFLFEELSHDPQVQVCGLLIFNTFANLTFMDNINLGNMAPMSHQLATFEFFQILGLRLKGAFIFEEPTIMSVIWFLAKPFMSEKIRSRFNLCGKNYGLIKEVIPDLDIQACLPNCLGGGIPDDDPSLRKWIEHQLDLLISFPPK